MTRLTWSLLFNNPLLMRKVPLPHWASNPFWSSLQSIKLSIWGSKRGHARAVRQRRPECVRRLWTVAPRFNHYKRRACSQAISDLSVAFIRDQSACAQFNTNPNQQCVQVVKNIAKQVESSCGQKVCPGLITRIVSTYSKVSITL